MKSIFLSFISSAILFTVTSCGSDQANASTPDKSVDKTESLVSEPEKAPEAWRYNEEVDKMDNSTSYFAQTTSTNEIEFDFPYNGGSTFNLFVRNRDKKNEVFIIVDKGQFMGSISGDRTVRLKFDDEKPFNVTYTGTTDASSNVIFLGSLNKVLPKLKTAKKLMVEAEFFNSGNRVIEFNVDGLNWKH